MSSLSGCVVIITGASSGIGAATALHLARLGCRYVVLYRVEQVIIMITKNSTGGKKQSWSREGER